MNVFFSEAAKYSMKTARPNVEVVFIGPHLDIGNISHSPGKIERHESLNELLNGSSTIAELQQLAEDQKKEMNQLLNAAKPGRTIRIWKSDAAFSASAFAYVCYHLKDVEADIQIVSLKKTWHAGDETMISYSHWGELAPEEFDFVLAGNEKLSGIEKESQAERWNVLKEENSLLRAVVNGQLISVPEDFYDHLLLKHLPEEEFLLGELIAEVIGAYSLGVSDSWYLYRIEEMIQNKKLTRIESEDTKHPYEQKLKKSI